MKAMYLEEAGSIVEKEIPRPEPAPDEVLVNVESVHVCASDVEYYEHGKIGEFVVEEPLILGHESAGIVEAVGEDVQQLAVGDRVALEPGVPCRRCEYCKRGRYNLCPDVVFMATPPHHGAFVEYIAHPEDFTYGLPDSVTLEQGAAVEPLSVGVHATRRAEMEMGDRVAVLGAGPIGLMVVQAARARGASEILITDLIDFRLEKALDMGADDALNLQEESLDKHKGRFERVFQAAGAPSAYRQSMELVARGGRVVHIGHPPTDTVEVDPNVLITREFDMVGSFRYCNTYPKAITMLAHGEIDVDPMISETFPLQDVEQALRMPREKPDQCVKSSVSV